MCVRVYAFPLFPLVYRNRAGPKFSRIQPHLRPAENCFLQANSPLSLGLAQRVPFPCKVPSGQTETSGWVASVWLIPMWGFIPGVTGLSCSLMSFHETPGLVHVHSDALGASCVSENTVAFAEHQDRTRLWANRPVVSLGATDRPSLCNKDVSLRDPLIPNTPAQPAGSTKVSPVHGISLTSYFRSPYFVSYHSLPCPLLLPDQAKASCRPSVSLGTKVEYRLSPTWVETASES